MLGVSKDTFSFRLVNVKFGSFMLLELCDSRIHSKDLSYSNLLWFPSFHPFSMHVTKSHHFHLLHIIILFPLHLFCLLCGVCFESREMHNLRKWKDDSNFFSLSSSPALLGFYRLVTTREQQRELRMETDYAMTS